jgi:ATP-dependent helicase/nuclease subunit A
MSRTERVLTAEQQAAIEARSPTVVLSSGAGCGKTMTLATCYLAQLRAGAAVGHLAAITFTDRAAREMRKRIREEMLKARPLDPSLWDVHLRDLETATISTIHAFCAGLLRQHALVAGIDPHFEVLEEVFSLNLRDGALDEAIQVLLTANDHASEDLRELVAMFGWSDVRKAIDELVIAADPSRWTSWGNRPPADIVDEWKSLHNRAAPRCIAHALMNEAAITRCLDLLRTVECPGPKMAERVAAIFDGIQRLPKESDPAKLIEQIREAAKVQGAEPGKKWPDQHEYERVRDALKDFRDALPGITLAFDDDGLSLERAAMASQRFLSVASVCRDAYQAAKARHRVLDFQDLLMQARKLLRDRPEIAQSLRRRYVFFLLDELQDTDPVQMELVELLTHKEPNRLFAVGDKKQSIYRFRGADVTQFDRLHERAPDFGRLRLTLNFRSQPGIIRFVNALFRKHMSNYEGLRAHRPQLTAEPCVEFLWSDSDGENADGARKLDARRIARRITQMIGQCERPVVDKNSGQLRPASLGDIVLLFRSMSNVAIYENALRDAEIDYHLVGGRAFFAQQEIYDLLNLMRALENPHDGLSLAGTLRSPFIGLSDDALFVLSRHADGLWPGLHDEPARQRLPVDDRPVAERAVRFLDRWRAQKDRLPIAGLINFVLADCGYDAALQFERYGDRKLANLWKLIELARTFGRAGRFGLADFIHRLDSAVSSETKEEQAATLPEDSNVIRLMTIHQAKGDEFPIVILPDIGAKIGGRHFSRAIWHNDFGCVVRPPNDLEPSDFSAAPWKLWLKYEELADWDEELRTFYVACTRARDFLVLAGSIAKRQSTALTVLADRFDLQTGACRDEIIAAGDRPIVRVVIDDESLQPLKLRRARRESPPLTGEDWQASQTSLQGKQG